MSSGQMSRFAVSDDPPAETQAKRTLLVLLPGLSSSLSGVLIAGRGIQDGTNLASREPGFEPS